jgi:NAD(P)-dependent dehydrogenase (short-subunit alcohol dehydrogenase family)
MTKIIDIQPAVLVTGVSSGIGLAIAEDLLHKGYRVFGSVRRAEDTESLEARWGKSFTSLVFDVTDKTTLENAVSLVESELDGQNLAALINNAGVSFAGPLIHQPLDEIRQTFEVNVFGVLTVTRAFLPLLGARSGAVGSPGRIVNISSVSGAITVPFLAAYSASKHAVEAFTQGLRRELKPYGIEVSAIEPGFIRSQLFEKSALAKPFERYTETDYVELWQQFNKSMLEQESKAKLPTVVTQAVRHAIQAKKPRTRYPLDGIWYVGKILPDRVFDQLIFRALGITKLISNRFGR